MSIPNYAQCYCTCAEKPAILFPVGNQMADSNSADLISYIGGFWVNVKLFFRVVSYRVEILTLERRFLLFLQGQFFIVHAHFRHMYTFGGRSGDEFRIADPHLVFIFNSDYGTGLVFEIWARDRQTTDGRLYCLKMIGKGFYRKWVKSSFEQFITTQPRVGSTNDE